MSLMRCTKHDREYDSDVIECSECIEEPRKVLIVGYPRVGKTQYSSKYEEVIHIDAFAHHGFKEQIYKVMEYLGIRKDWVIEGMQGMRLFRKMLQLNTQLPDKVIYIKPKFEADENHVINRKQLDTIWKDCVELNKDIEVEYI